MDNFEQQVDAMQSSWSKVPNSMKLFSSAMLRLGTELNVSSVSGEQAFIDFKNLRDDTRRDGQIYCKEILPVAEKVVQNMSNYFDNYEENMNYDDWKEDLDAIHKEVVEYKVTCDVLIKLHELLMCGLKNRLTRANTSFEEMQKLTSKYEESMTALYENAETLLSEADRDRIIGAIVGVFTLGIGYVLGNMSATAKTERAQLAVVEATAKDAQIGIIDQVRDLSVHVLVPALKAFIEGLTEVSEFFAVTEQALGKIVDNTIDEHSSIRYFNKTKSVARAINDDCKSFAKALPSIRSDMEAIPQDFSDRNFIDTWRENTIRELNKHYEAKMKKGRLEVVKKVLLAIKDKTVG